MAIPLLVWADDSEAILTFVKAALAGRFDVVTAADGREALERIRKLVPDLIGLDLSMPELSGEEVLDACRSDPALASIPIVVASAEPGRAHACLGRGADAVLAKPLRPETLLATLAHALEAAEHRKQGVTVPVLPLKVGGLALAVPLACVRAVIAQVACRPLAVSAPYLREVFEYEGTPVCVVDLATRLAVAYAEPLIERKLVLIELDGKLLALRVDQVSDPDEIAAERITDRQALGGGGHAPIGRALLGIASLSNGPLPIVDPAAFFGAAELRAVAVALGALAAEERA